MTCVAVGSPMPYVKWMKGLVELTKDEEMPLGRNVLEVTNIRESANYTCVAISSLGLIEATAQVTVKGEALRFEFLLAHTLLWYWLILGGKHSRLLAG